MFFLVDGNGLIDEQHRNAVVDAVLAPQSRVVELIVDQQERTPILGTDQDGEQRVVQRHPAQRPGVSKTGLARSIGLPGE